MIKFSKKMLALIMSMLMIFSCMAISASADDVTPPAGEGTEAPATPVDIGIPAPVCEFDQETLTITIAKPENIAHEEVFYPVAITAALGETALTVALNADGSYTIAGVELGKEYTITAKLVDDTNAYTGSASVTVVPTITVPGTKDICVFDAAERSITVEKIDNIIIGGEEYSVGVELQPAANTKLLGDGTTMFFNLEYATKYTVKAYVALTADDTYYSEDNFEVSVMGQQDTPATPVPTAITSSSITINASAGCEYTIKDENGVALETKKSEGTAAVVFENLDAETTYTIVAVKPAIEGYYASKEATISVTTKKAGRTDVPAIALEDKTNTSITVTAVDGAEYKLNDGAWQNSNVFTGLKADTSYTIYARYKFDAAKQDASKISDALMVKTNNAVNYEADASKITFSANDGAYANTEISFTVNGDGPADMAKAIYGDTRIVPVAYEVVYGEDTIKETNLFAGNAKVSQSGAFTPAEAYAEKTVKVIVTFSKEEYKGTDWVYADEQFTQEFNVTVGRVDGPMTKVTEFFEMLANFLLNTVPAFLAQAMQSDVWGALFAALGKLGGAIG